MTDKMTEKTYEINCELNQAEREKLNNYSDSVAKLLFHRGITDNETAEGFINADYETGTHDPFLMKDLVKAAHEILETIKRKEMICIFSDYDADGVPGAVALNDFFQRIKYENYFVYIPHRNLEGFGLNNEAIKEIAEKKAKLIITIDCGVADLPQIEFANELGIKTIVTDHHELAHGLPKAFAVVDPMREDCNYPYKKLCGAGVIYKVIQGLIYKIKNEETAVEKKLINEGWEKWLLDMVGIATLSDMVPLNGENRIFAKYGIMVLRKSPRPGLVKLISKGFAKQQSLNEEDVVFSITPKINAASRMGHPEAAFKMLSTRDATEAAMTVAYLEKINNERKGVVSGMVKEIKKFVDENLLKENKLSVPVIVKGNPKWSPSLLGLAASNIVDTYNCPVFLWGRGEGDELKGSCRSDGSASVVDVMQGVEENILETFGGHMMAGGFVIKFDGLEKLEDALIESYKKCAGSDTNLFHHRIDEKLQLEDVNLKLFNDIELLAPFGMNNTRPVFIFENVKLEFFEKFGKEKNHGKFIFQKKDGTEIQAIKFFVTTDKKVANLKSGDLITFSASLEKETFRGQNNLRLKLISVY